MSPEFPPPLDQLAAACAPLFEGFAVVRRVYVFGSVADGSAGARSDIDFGVVCARGQDRLGYTNLGFDLFARLSNLLATDRIDVVVLNATDSTDLRYAVVTDGKIVFDRGDDLEAFERQIRHEYIDYRQMRTRLGIR